MIGALLAFTLVAPSSVPAAATEPMPDSARSAAAPAAASAIVNGREYLVPELAANPFALAPGRREFLRRISFSPCAGKLGDTPLYAIRLAYNPNSWLGWEAAVGHNPGEGVHALTHSLSAQVRYPLPWRFQPYGSLGYGMILVYPGEALNADPVTSNVLYAGGGFELYVRSDLAIRAELRSATVLDTNGSDGETVAYDYGEVTWGLSFYRGLGN